MSDNIPSRPKRILGYSIIFITAVYPLHPAWGAITPADKNSQIIQQNNIPIVNIATPNGEGVSHNKFQNFNVDKQGAVLNNATANVNSQLARQVKANGNLKGHAANLIINEVTGSGRSQLLGKLEVAGKQANVLIANPNGITCNGCSFINTPAITLATGKPIMDKGALSAIEVKKGSVIIGSQGLNAEAQSYADIISRATELNGQIKAKNLTLMQGTNRVDFQKGTVTPIAGEGAKPSISVDTKALGGMYANQVRLISTEAGVGVNLSHIQTTQKDLTLTVDGKILANGNIQAKNNLNISTKDIQVNTNAKLQADNDITLGANTLNNQGQIIANKDMRIFSDQLTNVGDKTLIKANKDMWIQKNANGDLSTSIENKSATIKTEHGDLIVRTKKLINERSQSKYSIKNLQPNSTDKNLTMFDVLASTGYYQVIGIAELEEPLPKKWFGKVDFSGKYINDVFFVNDKQTEILLETNTRPSEIISGKNIYINSNELTNRDGIIKSQNNIILTGGKLTIQSLHNQKYYSYLRYINNKEHPEDTSWNKNLVFTYFLKRNENTSLIKPSDSIKTGIFSLGDTIADFRDNIFIGPDIYHVEANNILTPNNHSLIEARNIILNSNEIKTKGNITSRNDVSLISSGNIDIEAAKISLNNSLSILADKNIDISQSILNGRDIFIKSKSANINLINKKVNYLNKNSTPILSSIDGKNSLLLSAGNEISIDNVIFNKINSLNLNAKGNISISSNVSPLFNMFNLEPLEKKLFEGIAQNASKIKVWESIKDINIGSGKSISIQGIELKSNGAININAAHNINLNKKDKKYPSESSEYLISENNTHVIAKDNINLNAGKNFIVNTAKISSGGKTTVFTGKDVQLNAIAYSAIPNPDDALQDLRYHTSTLSGDKGLTIAANGSIITQGSSIKSLGDITLSSGGNIRLESIKTHYRKQSGKRLEDLYRQIGTEINSGKNLTILSQGSTLFQASKLISKGIIDIAAKGGYLYAQAMEETSHYEDQKKQCNKWTLCITRKTVRTTHSETKNKVTEFTAGGDINLFAKDDVILEATKINTGKNAKITSQTGKVNFKAVKNNTFEQVISNSKGFYITQRNKGYTEDRWILPAVHIGGKLTIDAAKGITADIKNKNNQSLQNALNSLGQTEGTLWLKDLKDRKDVQWNLVKDAYDGWDYKNQSLNPVASALIMISVAAMTSGTATQFAAWAASGTSGTTAAVISGAAYSGMTALATQAAVALAENQGNLSKTLNTLGRSDTVKSIMTQMAISGALNGLDVKMGWTKGNPGNAKLPLLSNGDWNKVAQRVAAQSVISSTINTSIQGGSFTDNFKNALLSNIGSQINAEGAKLIGDKGEILGHTGRLLSHSVVSGISAEISGGNVRGAIVGALAAELAAITLNSKLFEPSYINEREKQIALIQEAVNGNNDKKQFAKILGGIAGALVTHKPEGAFSAANSAELVYMYNYDEHRLTEMALENQRDILAASRGDKAAEKRVVARQEAAAFVGLMAVGGAAMIIGGEIIVAASPELLATAKVAYTGCKASFAYCINRLGIGAADLVAPEAAISGTLITGTAIKVIGSSNESAKILADSMINSTNSLLRNGKLNIVSLKPIIDKEQLRIAANMKVIEEINKLPSKSKAQEIATMSAAYDEKTGIIVVGKSVGSKINRNMLDERTIIFIEGKLRVKIGEKTDFCSNFAGGCSEVLAADQLIRKGILPSDIKISQAYRPRFSYGEDISSLPEVALIPTCENCVVVFKK